jgi:GxxExxY protein
MGIMNPEPLIHEELSKTIIGAAIRVLYSLRPGLNEKAYENALAIELRNRGHQIEQQRQFYVLYDGQVVDTLIPDLIVDSLVIVDPKVTETFTSTHYSQMIGYLAITHLRLALLLNFKHMELRWRRVVR